MWFGRGETGLCFNLKASCKMEPDCDTWNRNVWERCREQGLVFKQLWDPNPSAAKKAATDPCRPSQPADYRPRAETRHRPSTGTPATRAMTSRSNHKTGTGTLLTLATFTERPSAIMSQDKNTDAEMHIFHSLMTFGVPAKRLRALSSGKEKKHRANSGRNISPD